MLSPPSEKKNLSHPSLDIAVYTPLVSDLSSFQYNIFYPGLGRVAGRIGTSKHLKIKGIVHVIQNKPAYKDIPDLQ